MQIQLLKNIVSIFVGQNASAIVDLLLNKKNVNEFIIAKKLNLTINQTRNVLYKLADEGLVSFIRKKDRKKGGWYTYFWTLNIEKSLARFKDKMVNDIAHMKEELSVRKSKCFFYCKSCNIEYSEENALLHNYICPECGEVLEMKEACVEVERMEKEIAKLEGILASINTELEGEGKKHEKEKSRKSRVEKKKKEKEKLARKKEKEKLARKEEKLKLKKKLKKGKKPKKPKNKKSGKHKKRK